MPDSVVLAGLAPHPPIIIPEIGRGEEQLGISTVRAMDELGKEFTQSGLDTLVIITPHGPVFGARCRCRRSGSSGISGSSAPDGVKVK